MKGILQITKRKEGETKKQNIWLDRQGQKCREAKCVISRVPGFEIPQDYHDIGFGENVSYYTYLSLN